MDGRDPEALTLDPRLRGLLVCPRCRGELEELPAVLRCEPCLVDWPIRDGVPWLVEEHAIRR